MHQNSALEALMEDEAPRSEQPAPSSAVTMATTPVQRASEKEVNFSDVLVVAQRSPSVTSSKAVITFPKSIIKNSSLDSSSKASSSSASSPNWDTHPLKPDSASTAPPDSKGGVIDTIGLIGHESDPESEADLFRVMSRKDVSMESDCPEGSVLSLEEDDDDFKVHFVHHGKKKVEDEMNPQSDLMYQISELQEAVVSMKASLKEAVTKLSLVEGTSLGPEVEEMKRKCEGNSAEILKMVLALKTDFSSLRHEVTSVSKRQDALQKSFRLLLEDRRILANDLSQAGVISQHTRNRLDSFSSIVGSGGTGGQSGSGSHSNDSGVALLLEKTHNVFTDESGALHLSGQRTSDQDSLPEQPALLVPASVYDYVAGLSQPNHSFSSSNATNTFFCQDSLPSAPNEQTLHVKDEPRPETDDLAYDSDSSLTLAANKTISLSTCIGQEMRVNEGFSSLPSKSSPSKGGGKRASRGESEGSDSAKERSSSQGRRRRPVLGVSSAKIYQSSGHCYTSAGEKESHSRHRYVTKGGDPREAQRYKLVKELVDTEKQYCRTLWTIQDTFAEPLKKAALLSNKDISTLFPEEVYQLYDKHCLLQHQLKERLASWKWQPLIGDILARFTDPHQCEVLRLYTSYVNDFPEVLKTFHKLCHTSQPFTEFIKGCLDQPSCRGLDLGAFLLTPVQRVPKYILLLKQLLKYTDSRHPDYRLIDTVLERLRDFLSRLNDAMEHSFRLVNSSLSPSIPSTAGLTVKSAPSNKYRNGRTSRKSGSSRESPSYSPSNRRNRHARIYQPSSSSPSESYRSPKRSCSSAGGASTAQKLALLNSSPGRSASLPRGFPSLSSDSPDSSGDGQEESSPERSSRSRSESASRYHAHEATPYHTRAKYSTLMSARSVTNIASGEESRSRWEELASSEPSLVNSKLPPSKALSKKSPASNSSSNIHAAANAAAAASHQKLVTWTDGADMTDEARAKKKTSIKSSIKNIFTFKKRPNCPRGREEPLYWPSSVIMEASAECSPDHLYGSTVPQAAQREGSIGDFVDEDGNPCSNV